MPHVPDPNPIIGKAHEDALSPALEEEGGQAAFRPDPTPFHRAVLKSMQRQERNLPPSLRRVNGHMVASYSD